MSYEDKQDLDLSPAEAQMVLSSLGYINHGRKQHEWRGNAKCHGGDGKANFSFHYGRGVAQCWTAGCFGEGTDIYGVVEHEMGSNFYHSKRYVEEVIGRKLSDNFSDQKRSSSYFDNFMQSLKSLRLAEQHAGPRKIRFLSNTLWAIYARNNHSYWASRGFDEETLKYFKTGYNTENQRVTIPIFDIDDAGHDVFIAMKERIASDDNSLITESNPKYLHDSFEAGKVVFNLNNAAHIIRDKALIPFLDFPGIILVEGHLDAMMCFQYGFPNVVAIGTNQMTKDQAKKLEKHTSNILIIPDEDERWNEEKKQIDWRGGRLIETAYQHLRYSMNIYVSRMKPYKDVASLSGEYGREILTCMIQNRQRMR